MFEPLRAVPTIAVSDIERAKQFYGETLGLKTIDSRADGVRYDGGGGTFVLVYPSGFAGTAASTYMGFTVDVDWVLVGGKPRGELSAGFGRRQDDGPQRSGPLADHRLRHPRG